MAAYDLEEQEQLDELKTWWKMYGNLVTGHPARRGAGHGRLAGLELVAAPASGTGVGGVFNLQAAAMQRDVKRVRELAGELIDKYSVTDYAGMGAMLAARVQVDTGDARNARVQLAWAAENAKDPGLRDLARLRHWRH
jgi:predicted negative regulator of RcsB-dependent stress response